MTSNGQMASKAEQIAKIRGDLAVTQQNMCIFGEMLTELTPGQEHPEDRTLFDQLHGVCRTMQTRLVELIDKVDDDKLTADLLEVNDNMNNLFLRYDRYEKNKSSTIPNCSQPPAPNSSNQPRNPTKNPVLAVAAARSQLPASQKASETPLIDFSSGDSEHASVARDMSSLDLHKDEDAAHIAEWIGDKEDKEEGITSSEFDKFLAERAAAGDTTPRKGD